MFRQVAHDRHKLAEQGNLQQVQHLMLRVREEGVM